MKAVKLIDIVSKKPVNKTAALVVGSSKERHLNHKSPNAYESETPYKTMDRLPFHSRKTLKDLTGIKTGRLTVLGYSSEYKRRWVVRCDCGRYCLRKNKPLTEKRTGKVELMCSGCEKTFNMRRHDEFKRLGFNTDNF